MPDILADRVKETTTTTGTGTVNLGGAIAQYQSFVNGIGNGNTTTAVFISGNSSDWEVDSGCLVTSGSPNTLTRGTLLASSTGSRISLSGTSTVASDFSAALINTLLQLPSGSTITPTSGQQYLEWTGLSGNCWELDWGNLGPNTNAGIPRLQVGYGSTPTWDTGNNYTYGFGSTVTGVQSFLDLNGTNAFTSTVNSNCAGFARIYQDPGSGAGITTYFNGTSQMYSGSSNLAGTFTGQYFGGNAITAIRLYLSSGDWRAGGYATLRPLPT